MDSGYKVNSAPRGTPPDDDGRYPLAEAADRIALCAELAQALVDGYIWRWRCDDPHYAPILTDRDRQEAIDYLAGSLGGARSILLGRHAPPYVD